ncbi:MAG: Xcc1710-like domain-containing protein [Betaproteobacteria bacterium]|nr:Xcc1710-like domain-containing protein [Betaproteobacteria bacterium]NCP82475.1 Xcc1710-like domain-containing protein [Rhodoferax sp.]OIP18773.1 MAG: hypothetical protein AUK50_05555 [Comamonadaceae bacterium CG2_30_57_122]PIZ22428.1 MAG: hypothetical protein COY49_08710 [Comamonadaceae bacterium CG_4_10_14_0_8_um_filter_57_29]PJC14917.1 MAG: hypothetical protein CO065_13055 [Comamonadaceae bacterium CG_4_9_14_0_8_um_filter_57_21]
MKFHPDVINVPFIKSYGTDWVEVGSERLSSSFVMSSTGERFAWNCAHFEDLTAAHFDQLAKLHTELVIFGSGARLRFPAPALITTLIKQQIGLETMDMQAACRTYNILAGEGRRVAVALLMES